jgi:predicted signal transduction protein with EAL and GGDEF domain
MKVVAEGVEEKEQLLYLNQHACDQIQGYLFSKPLPIEQLTPLLRKGKCNNVSYNAKNIGIENRRKFFRVHLPTPLASDMTIVEIKKIKQWGYLHRYPP